MVRSHHPKLRRGGFTLVEMIVVIAIIAVLAALITPAVMKYLGKGPQITTAAEISNLDTALQNFQNTMKVRTIPSKIKLCEMYGDYNLALNPAGQPVSQIDVDSVAYLTQLFPHILDVIPNPPANNLTLVIWRTNGIDWNGDRAIGNNAANRTFILEGDQCLVFFLGGIPLPGPPGGCRGFSTDPRDPAKSFTRVIGGQNQPEQTTGRTGPFFEFPSARLTKRPTATGAPAPPFRSAGDFGFYSFLDPHKKTSPNLNPPRPDGNWYAFYSAHGTAGTYNPFGGNDCAGLTQLYPAAAGAKVYTEAAGRFYKASTWQIISAGADGLFEPAASVATSRTLPDNSNEGKDNQSNFNNGSLLGVSN